MSSVVCNVISVARLKESIGWNQAWMSPYLESVVDQIAVNAKMANPGHDGCSRMIAASYGSIVQLWQISDNGQSTREIGRWYQMPHGLCMVMMLVKLSFSNGITGDDGL